METNQINPSANEIKLVMLDVPLEFTSEDIQKMLNEFEFSGKWFINKEADELEIFYKNKHAILYLQEVFKVYSNIRFTLVKKKPRGFGTILGER